MWTKSESIMNLLLYIPYFRRIALKYAFDCQRKPKDFSKLSFAFIDSNGKRYYTWDDKTDIPIKRMQAIQVCMLEQQACLTGNELHVFLNAMDKALERVLTPRKGEKVSGLAEVGYLLTEMRLRKDNLVHEEILFKMLALTFVREDEDFTHTDEEIQKQKIQQFKKDADGGLHDFFYGSALKEFIPFANMSAQELKEHIRNSTIRLRATMKMMDRFNTSDPLSSTAESQR